MGVGGVSLHQIAIPGWLFALGALPILLLALLKGDWKERALSAALAVQTIVKAGLIEWEIPLWSAALLDLMILAVCLNAALRSDRYWTIVASSFALLSVVTHGFRLARGVTVWAYLSLERVWCLFLLGALCAGVWAMLRPPPPAAANEA